MPPRLPILAPFQLRSYRRQWPADLAVSWAAEMENLALGWFILVQTGSVLLLTVFASLQFLGTLIAPLFGLAGDRLGHRNLLCVMRAFYLALAAVLAGFAFAGGLDPVVAFIVAALAGMVRPSDIGLRNVLISENMPPDRLMGAVSLSRVTADSARIVGALAGAGMVATLGMAWAYAMIVGLYATSLALTLAIPGRAAQRGAARRPAASPLSPWRDLRDAVGMVWQTPPQLAAISLAFLLNLTAYPFVLGLLPFIAREVYGTDQAGLGWLVAGAAGGCVLASVLLSRLEGRVLPGRFMIGFAMGWQALTILLGQTADATTGFLLLVLIGLVQGLSIVPMSVLQLRNAPPALRGRINGLRTLAVYGLPIGLWVAGPLIEAVGFAMAATLYGGIGLLCSLAMLLRWRAHLWPEDAPANSRR